MNMLGFGPGIVSWATDGLNQLFLGVPGAHCNDLRLREDAVSEMKHRVFN